MKNTIIVGVVLFMVGALVGFGADREYMRRRSDANDTQMDQKTQEGDREPAKTETESGQQKADTMKDPGRAGEIIGPVPTGQISASTGHNSISVEDQEPGSSVTIQSLTLGMNGWVVIHDDREGMPGHILGARRFNAGTYTGQNAELLKQTEEGKVYYAVLHADDGDRKFDYRVDLPIKDDIGNMVLMRFVATAQPAQSQ